ncbi:MULTISPECIES: hypothetical protein [unclassified Microbacterium]|uniref:hypothetical protein n=1 Tax=unclassified Microbacterium TaxID=2609290 RepID=UPI0038674678
MKILYWAVHDPSYPRNERLRAYLQEELAAEITVVARPDHGSRASRLWQQGRAAFTAPTDYSIVILSEFSLLYAFASKIAALRSRAIHIVDFFVGFEETEIGDFALHSRLSLRAYALRSVDRFAVRSATVCLTDTRPRATRFAKRFGRRFLPLPVGAPDWATTVEMREPEADVLYYGNYLPLHNTLALVRGIAAAEPSPLPSIFIGDGPSRGATEALVRSLGLNERIQFLDALPPSEIGRHMGGAQVVAGIFGDSDKAREVVANKVWQSLTAGIPTVTRSSPALDDLGDATPKNLLTVQGVSPDLIARAIESGRTMRSQSAIDVGATRDSLQCYVASGYKAFGSTLVDLVGASDRKARPRPTSPK